MKKLLLITLLILFNCAPVTKYYLSPYSSEMNVDKFFSDDKEILFCEGKETDLFFFIHENLKELVIYTAIINKSDDSRIDVIPERIKAFAFNKANKNKQLKVYSAQEYQTKIKNAQAFSEFFVSLGGAVSAINAAKSRSYTTGYTGNTYSSYTTTTYDNSKSQESLDRTKRDLDNMRTGHALENQYYDNVLLKKNTLPPKASTEGYVFIQQSHKLFNKKYTITIPVGIDEYKIIINRKPVPNYQ